MLGSRFLNAFRYSSVLIKLKPILPQQNIRLSSRSTESSVLQEISAKLLNRRKTEFVNKLEFIDPSKTHAIPIYRVMDLKGKILESSQDPNLSPEVLLKIYKDMTLVNALDVALDETLRQGAIAFYIANYGEEGAQVGSGAALEKDDLIFGQYRETGVLIWRGYSLSTLMAECFANKDDLAKGRNLPLFFGSPDINYVIISSPLATQMPQAVGAAHAFKRQGSGRVVACYFGDGAASMGDAHAACNFAATLKCPIIFFCRNNGYAISTSSEQQYASDGIAGQGVAYGLLTIRVDGNDVLAVYNAVRKARELAATNQPVLVEAITYRLGPHSAVDDSTLYRSWEEVEFWREREPRRRFRRFLEHKGLWNQEKETEWTEQAQKGIRPHDVIIRLVSWLLLASGKLLISNGHK